MSSTIPKHSGLRTPPSVIAGILAVSALASALICWLVYFHAPTDVAGTQLRSLPLVNAVLNALATVAIVTGYVEIRRRRVLYHRASMFFAFFFSSIFLVSYLVNFTLHGETRFNRLSPLWPFYWKLLASHIVLSVFALPLILITFFLFAHRALSRAPQGCALDFPDLAVCLGHRRRRLPHAGGVPVTMQQDTRHLLRTGIAIFSCGVLAALLTMTVFGGIGRQGPHTNSGWLALMVTMACLPTGTLTLALAIAKLVGDRKK